VGKESLSWLDATGMITATTIGAGILALPIALYPFGTLGAALLLLAAAGLSLAASLLITEALMRTDHQAHFPALVDRHLGPWGCALVTASLAAYIYGALAAYVISGGALLEAWSGGAVPNWAGEIIYFAALALVVYGGMGVVKRAEEASSLAIAALALLISALALPHFAMAQGSAGAAAIPGVFGLVLFAFFGHSIIPSLRMRMGRDWRGLLRALLLGTALVAVIYIAWTTAIAGAVPGGLLAAAGASGQPATIPLGAVVGPVAILLGGIFALFSTGSSYVGSCFSLVDIFRDEFHELHRRIGKGAALMLSALPPLALALLMPHGFVKVLELAGLYGGGIAIGVVAPITYLAARRHGRREPEFSIPAPLGEILASLLLGVTLAMLIYETWSLLSGA